MLNQEVKCRSHAGFTLLEIIIALAIVVVAVIGIYGGLIKNVKDTAEINERLLANWVAANAIAEMRLASRSGVLNLKNDTVKMGGRDWRYEMDAIDAPNPAIAKLDVRVFSADENTPSITVTAYMQNGQ